ncbi:MAG: hypothetical protein F2534_10700, partial [Actinobacteria bacterium]|nr:hypothetical protein [Actinomycetota bacterium]
MSGGASSVGSPHAGDPGGPGGVPPRVLDLLDSVAGRLRLAWGSEMVQWAAPIVATVALGLVVAGWFLPIGWLEWAALALALAAVVAVLVTAIAVRIPTLVAARAADRGLATHDAFAAALQFAGHDDAFAGRITRRADHLAAGARAVDAVPLRFHRNRTLAAGTLAVVAVVLAMVPNPQDERRRERAAEAAAVEQLADELRADADELATRGETAQAAAERLRQLADELARTDSLTRAEELALDAAAEMSAGVPDDLLSQKAATQGLERSLSTNPLAPGAPTGVADQLAALADQLDGLDPDELAALADRLADL